MKAKFNTFVLLILVLSVIGFVFLILTDPIRLFRNILMTIIFACLIFLIISRLRMPSREVRNEQKAFIKAARNSKKRFKNQSKQSRKVKPAIRKRHAPHLTVIEGKKGKKKNRAIH